MCQNSAEFKQSELVILLLVLELSRGVLWRRQLCFCTDKVRLPLKIIRILPGVSVLMLAPTSCWALATQCQLVSTGFNSKSSWLSLPSYKSHQSYGADLGSELTANFMGQKKLLDLSQYINP